MDKPQAGALVKLSGQMISYRCKRAYASFVYSQTDQHKLGVVAVVAAAAGMGGQAVSTAASVSDMEEPADYVEFDLNGHPVKGWLWRSPFKEGDVVDIAAEWDGDHYEVYGISRPVDRMIALYPHCSRAKTRHIKNSLKWWAICNAGFFGAMGVWFVYLGGIDFLLSSTTLWTSCLVGLAFVPMFVSLSRQYMPFVLLSEKIFRALGLPNATNVDLVRSSKVQRSADDAAEYGTFYFRF